MGHQSPQHVAPIRITLLFFYLAMAVGCTPTGSLTKTKPYDFNPKHYRTVMIKVSASENDSDTPKDIDLFEDILFRKIKDKKLFPKVIKGSNSSQDRSDLIINAELLRTKHISRKMEFWFGALAGRAEVIVNIDLVDQASEKNMATFRVSGESAGGSILAGTTEEAFNQAVDRVIAFIMKWYLVP